MNVQHLNQRHAQACETASSHMYSTEPLTGAEIELCRQRGIVVLGTADTDLIIDFWWNVVSFSTGRKRTLIAVKGFSGEVLFTLARHYGKTLTLDELHEIIFAKYEITRSRHAMHMWVNRLRNTLQNALGEEGRMMIETVRHPDGYTLINPWHTTASR